MVARVANNSELNSGAVSDLSAVNHHVRMALQCMISADPEFIHFFKDLLLGAYVAIESELGGEIQVADCTIRQLMSKPKDFVPTKVNSPLFKLVRHPRCLVIGLGVTMLLAATGVWHIITIVWWNSRTCLAQL